ncbi:DUF3833 family protein [Novosphingobium album (ex Hu et al. 2023)]|uniref:DUF3833 domain-containing protein n=1 Tax=Novosphingobium album (ex Hu et al. 2023) TaxID=2930093 RepID=A0ABT0B3Z5_9SPHN|nr:DUF3833 family protein [Novosphingobium album (ex Hu et al. 2023)]MCJ2179756.1 DUF3833 domain-containing protein [Novosphingobium album (ex Hu et al. 2023)]
MNPYPRRAAKVLAAASLTALAGCVSTPRGVSEPIAAAPQPRFDALAFFTGHSEGRAKLKKIFSAPVDVHVISDGSVEDGTLHLVQTVQEGAKPPRQRSWTMRETSPGHYSGTLSDAEGEVTGETLGNRLHLSFKMKGGFPTQQWLTLSPDGHRAHNVMKVRKLGLTVGVLVEDIRKD